MMTLKRKDILLHNPHTSITPKEFNNDTIILVNMFHIWISQNFPKCPFTNFCFLPRTRPRITYYIWLLCLFNFF